MTSSPHSRYSARSLARHPLGARIILFGGIPFENTSSLFSLYPSCHQARFPAAVWENEPAVNPPNPRFREERRPYQRERRKSNLSRHSIIESLQLSNQALDWTIESLIRMVSLIARTLNFVGQILVKIRRIICQSLRYIKH